MAAHPSASSGQALMKTSTLWFVYMLLCDKATYYIGITNDLSKRFSEHQNKQSLHTKRFTLFELVYCEKYFGQKIAAKREKQLKGWSRAKKHMLVQGTLGINSCTEFAKGLLRNGNSLNLS